MRRICAVALCLATVFICCGCGKRYESSYSVIDAYVKESGNRGKLYASSAEEESGEYLSPEQAVIMFGTEELTSDYALLVNTRLDSIFELGVFRVESRDEELRLTKLLSERIMLLRTLASGDGAVTVECNLVIYRFGEDIGEIERTLSKILD